MFKPLLIYLLRDRHKLDIVVANSLEIIALTSVKNILKGTEFSQLKSNKQVFI